MKYLEAKKQGQRPAEENKMQSGSLPNQQSVSPDVLAKQLGVDLTKVTGTGENGDVTAKDVRAAHKKLRDANQKNPPISGVGQKPNQS